MKRLKGILDFLITLVNAWKVVLPILLLILSIIITVLKFGTKNIIVTLPVWAVLIIAALALYPLGKSVEYSIRRKKVPDFKLNGLLWRVRFLFFRLPIPICPHEGCGCQVIYKEIPPQPIQAVTSLAEINNVRFEYRYVYECPIHGRINGVPSENIRLLQQKAKLALKK